MPLKLEIKKKLSSRSDRVKWVDIHPDLPWVLSALYNGTIFIWNHETQSLVKSFEVTDAQPIRCAKFIARKQWIVCGSDDMMIRVYNINTMEKVKEFEAHIDYIRNLEVHPNQPYLLSSSDDMTIKLWDWDKNWEHTQSFEGHAHYVMMVKFNPKDTNTFASASLDRTIKVWSLGSPLPNFSLEGHERGVNCLDYYVGGDKPYLVSGADDRTIIIWDYQTKSCVQTLEGHTNNVDAVVFHPKLPLIISGSEDGTVRMWHNTTYRLETTLNYGMERTWSLAVAQGTSKVAIGYDEGTVVIMLGEEMPVISMDNSGKLLFAKNNEISSGVLRNIPATIADGDQIQVQKKEIGACEIFPQSMQHNSNGRFVCVCGDGEYIIYTSQALRNKSFGSALDFAWSSMGTGDYAVRESSMLIETFKNFKKEHSFRPPFAAEGLHGGHMIAVLGNEFIVFYDWETATMVRRIDVEAKNVYWSDSGDMVLIACEDSYFVLECNMDVIAESIQAGNVSEEGVEGSFELLHEISETLLSGQWVGDCFLYTNSGSRLNYYVGGEVMTLAHLDKPMNVIGFIARENRVFLVDKLNSIVSYKIMETILQYQTAVVRQDFDLANEILPAIPKENHDEIARFLESQGFKEQALEVSTDPDQKFDLAFQLERFELALTIMKEEIAPVQGNTTDTQSKWKQLGDLALTRGNLPLAEECSKNASDLGSLLLMYTSTGNAEDLQKLGELAKSAGKTNVAFLSYFLLGDIANCLEILKSAGRVSEAAFLANTYAPSLLPACVESWKENLKGENEAVASAIAHPKEHPERFPDYNTALDAENFLKQALANKPSASVYSAAVQRLDQDLIEMIKSGSLKVGGASVSSTPTPVPVETPKPAEPTPTPVEAPKPAEPTPAPIESAPAPEESTPAVASVPLISESAPAVEPAVVAEDTTPEVKSVPLLDETNDGVDLEDSDVLGDEELDDFADELQDTDLMEDEDFGMEDDLGFE